MFSFAICLLEQFSRMRDALLQDADAQLNSFFRVAQLNRPNCTRVDYIKYKQELSKAVLVVEEDSDRINKMFQFKCMQRFTDPCLQSHTYVWSSISIPQSDRLNLIVIYLPMTQTELGLLGPMAFCGGDFSNVLKRNSE